MRLLLLSNGVVPGRGYLAHAVPTLHRMLRPGDRVAFVPYAQHLTDQHTELVAAALAPLCVELVGVHRGTRPRSVVDAADAVFVGGGNAFRLLTALYQYDLVEPIRGLVHSGRTYVGSSAGTNVACPSIRTTNDMPIAQPPTFEALGLVPFQVNPHYPADEVMAGHFGESRDKRLSEFLEDNDVPVLGLHEGSWVQVEGKQATLGGVAGGRLFRRGSAPTDLRVGTDLSHLLSVAGHFDNPVG